MPEAKGQSAGAAKAFFRSIRNGSANRVKQALARGLDPNIRFNAEWGKEPALPYALRCNQPALARALVQAGADVHATGAYRHTPLHLAADLKLAALLLDHGADLEARDQEGQTPLHIAAMTGDTAWLTFLLDRGAELETRDKEGRTAYQRSTSVETRALLRQRGAKLPPAPGGAVLQPRRTAGAWKDVNVERGCLGVDGAGRVWLCGYQGVFCFDGKALVRYRFKESMSFDVFARGPGEIAYFATNWGLLRFAGGVFTLFRAENSELHGDQLTDIATDAKGRVYCRVYEDPHLSLFDGKRFQLLRPGVALPQGLASELSCMAVSPEGSLVFGTEEGLVLKQGGKWKAIKKFGRGETFDPSVGALCFEGRALWIGTQDAVYRYQGGRFERFEMPDVVNALCLAQGALWVGMYYGGLGRLAEGQLTVQKPEDSELPHEDVAGLAAGKDGALWVQAGSGVARVVDGRLERMTSRRG